jgi:hypothetical protein
VAVPAAKTAAAVAPESLLPTAGRGALHSSISKGRATVRRNFRPCVSFTTGSTAAVNFRPWNGTAKPTTMTGVAARVAGGGRFDFPAALADALQRLLDSSISVNGHSSATGSMLSAHRLSVGSCSTNSLKR